MDPGGDDFGPERDLGADVDAGGEGPDAGPDIGMPVAAGCGPEAATGSLGERTPYPDIELSVSPNGFQVLTVNYIVTDDGDPRGPLLEVYAEVQNTRGEPECLLLPDAFLGFDELIALVEAPAHFNEFSSVTDDCLPDGGIGVMTAVARGISETDLENARSFSIDMNPNTFGEHVIASNTTLSDEEIVETEEGFLVSGTVTPTASIFNYGIRAYPIDSRGLVVGELLAFPGNLDTLAVGVGLPFETEATECEFDEYLTFESWIVND